MPVIQLVATRLAVKLAPEPPPVLPSVTVGFAVYPEPPLVMVILVTLFTGVPKTAVRTALLAVLPEMVMVGGVR